MQYNHGLILALLLHTPPASSQPEAPYPDTAGWLPLVRPRAPAPPATAPPTSLQRGLYRDQRFPRYGRSVADRGGDCPEQVYEKTNDGYDNHDEHYANKGECLPGSTVKLRGHIQCVSGNQEWYARAALLSTSRPVRSPAEPEHRLGSWKDAAVSPGFATVPPACRPGGTVESTPAKIDGSASGYTLDGPTLPIIIDSEGKMTLSAAAGDHWYTLAVSSLRSQTVHAVKLTRLRTHAGFRRSTGHCTWKA